MMYHHYYTSKQEEINRFVYSFKRVYRNERQSECSGSSISGTDPLVRICTKTLRIRNTGFYDWNKGKFRIFPYRKDLFHLGLV